MQEIEALGASVCGVSVDGQERLAQFAAKYRLPFLLLSDRRGPVAARYGSLVNLGLLRFARRNTFLIDPEGRITRVYSGVDPVLNAQEITADLKKLATSG
jgi:thioredoxin-dependent peroxiredoxin